MPKDPAVLTARGKWLWLAIAVAIAVAAAACKGGSEFSGEPGGTIAFVSSRDGNGEIYVMQGDGAEETNITNNPAEDIEPSWSPDASRVLFSSYREQTANIFTAAADGSDVQQLTAGPAVAGGAYWSPDGSRIALYSFRQQGKGIMWVMNADGTDPQPVLTNQPPGPQTACSGGFPAGWFPDSEQILFRGSQGGISALQLCSVKTDGSDLKVILSEENVRNYYPSLSPDSREIAFTSDRDGNPEIYVMNADGGAVRRLTDSPANDEYPAWSPDGQWIAFQSDRDGNRDVYIARPDGGDVRRLTDNDADDYQPSWSPR